MRLVAMLFAVGLMATACATTPSTSAEAASQLTDAVADLVDESGLDGASFIIVTADDGVIYEQYFGSFDASRVSLVASASKMISAGVLVKLDEEGLLDIDAPVATQIEWPTGNADITPAQLVSNSSGLVGLGPERTYEPYLCQWTSQLALDECGATIFGTNSDDADQVQPDTEFRYGGAQWQVAGAVAQAASGKSWQQLVQETYVEPCGLDSLGYVGLDGLIDDEFSYPTEFAGNPANIAASANPNIEAGAHITASDYAKLLLMHLRGGTCGDEQVHTPQSLGRMYVDRIATEYNHNAYDNSDVGYGMGWWIERTTGQINDGGAWGTLPWLDLGAGYGALLVLEDSQLTATQFRSEIGHLVEIVATAE